MKWLLYLLPLVCLSATPFNLRKDPTVASWGGAPAAASTPSLDNVTNLADYPCTAFYQVSSSTYTTNGITVSLSPVLGSYPFTNNASGGNAGPARISANINGYDSLYFSAAPTLFNSGYTNTQPFEFVVVISLDGYPAGNTYAMGNLNDFNFRIGELSSKHWFMSSSSGLTGTSLSTTNKFIVLDCVFNGSSSTGYTNNGVDISGNVGSTQINQMMLGGANNSGTFKGWLAAIAIYGNSAGNGAIPGTNATARTAVFSALTNFYAITP